MVLFYFLYFTVCPHISLLHDGQVTSPSKVVVLSLLTIRYSFLLSLHLLITKWFSWEAVTHVACTAACAIAPSQTTINLLQLHKVHKPCQVTGISWLVTSIVGCKGILISFKNAFSSQDITNVISVHSPNSMCQNTWSGSVRFNAVQFYLFI